MLVKQGLYGIDNLVYRNKGEVMLYKWSIIVVVLVTLVGCGDNSNRSGASQLIGNWVSNCLPNGLIKIIEFSDNEFVIKGEIHSAADCSGSPYIVTNVNGTYKTRLSSFATEDSELFEIDYVFKDGGKSYDIFSINEGELHFGDSPESLNKEVASNRPTVLSQDEFFFK